ncbi:MAG TPA: methyltransferase domain-containing protein [Candidatus Dormibacteraeota bacterium]
MERPPAVKAKEFFPDLFSRHAESYRQRLEDIMARGEARGRMRMLELAGLQPRMRVLDLACGPGNLSRLVAARIAPGGEVVGIDLAPGMIDLARRSGIVGASFEVMDIEQLAFADATFDGAICGHGLQFAPNLSRALSEARRVLKPGGRLAASVPASPIRDCVWGLLDGVIDRWLPSAPEVIDAGPTRQTIRDPHALRQAALGAGFASATVVQLEEVVHWESAEHLVSMFMGWWDCASRMENVNLDTREALKKDAIAVLKRDHPGTISTTGRNLVLVANT